MTSRSRSAEHLYVIVPVAALTRALVRQCVETSLSTLRKNVAGTHAVLKFKPGPLPRALGGSATIYSHAEIRRLMATPAWSSALP